MLLWTGWKKGGWGKKWTKNFSSTILLLFFINFCIYSLYCEACGNSLYKWKCCYSYCIAFTSMSVTFQNDLGFISAYSLFRMDAILTCFLLKPFLFFFLFPSALTECKTLVFFFCTKKKKRGNLVIKREREGNSVCLPRGDRWKRRKAKGEQVLFL